MKLNVKKSYGSIFPHTQEDKDKLDSFKDGAIYSVEIKNMDTRTIAQNSAMHKYFSMLASELNKQNLSVTTVLKPDVMWSTLTIKEQIWKPIQKAVLNKNSTTKLNKTEITDVYDVVNKALGERFGIHVPFPTKELGE